MRDSQIVAELRRTFPKFADRIYDYPFPKPYCKDKKTVRAIYLGCDPSNNYVHDMKYVFMIGHEHSKFNSFKKFHKTNLNEVGLDWDSVYTQNICRNYFSKETSANLTFWRKAAVWWLERLKRELDQFPKDIPVLLTSQYLHEVLVNGSDSLIKAVEYYKLRREIPIPPTKNVLDRPLIPLYRGKNPNLKKNYHLINWREYKERVTRAIAGLNM